MPDQGEAADQALWTDGDMTLRIEGTDRAVRIDRPFALVGQGPGCDIRLAGASINRRHVYLHLDPRGVYAVDLVSRSGIRINEEDQVAGWLGPGDCLEVDGHRLELLRIRIDGAMVDPPVCRDDLLADDPGSSALVPLALESARGSEGPWSVGSELMFLGWSSSCAIQVKDPSVAKVHCVLVRTLDEAYIVDLQGDPLRVRVDGRPVRGSARLDDGADLSLGGTRFTVRIGQALRRLPSPSASLEALEPPPLVARVLLPELLHEAESSSDPGTSLDRASADSQHALFAWMVQTIQQTQGAVLRQQGEVQATLAGMLRQIQQDNSTLLNAHLQRIERIDHELASLRSELAERAGEPSAPPSPPQVAPLRVERTTTEPAGTRASTTWLLQRVQQLETENRSAWKDLLGRIAPPPRRPPAP